MHNVTPLTPFVYKMHVKLKEECHQCPLFPTPCWHINENNMFHLSLLTPKNLCLFGTNCNEDNPLLEPQLLQQPHKKKQPMKPTKFK
jgi:hypothetical protein